MSPFALAFLLSCSGPATELPPLNEPPKPWAERFPPGTVLYQHPDPSFQCCGSTAAFHRDGRDYLIVGSSIYREFPDAPDENGRTWLFEIERTPGVQEVPSDAQLELPGALMRDPPLPDLDGNGWPEIVVQLDGENVVLDGSSTTDDLVPSVLSLSSDPRVHTPTAFDAGPAHGRLLAAAEDDPDTGFPHLVILSADGTELVSYEEAGQVWVRYRLRSGDERRLLLGRDDTGWFIAEPPLPGLTPFPIPLENVLGTADLLVPGEDLVLTSRSRSDLVALYPDGTPTGLELSRGLYTFADFDDDGFTDYARVSDDVLSLFFGPFDPRDYTSSPPDATMPLPGTQLHDRAVDVDGDGFPELVLGYPDGVAVIPGSLLAALAP